MRTHSLFALVLLAATAGIASAAHADNCTRVGVDVTCDDDRRGVLAGDAILWPDGTRSSSTPHPSVIIGNKSSVVIGPGVFAGNGKGGYVPMENPSAPNKARCPVLDGVSYCY
jgi:hypothetical protein